MSSVSHRCLTIIISHCCRMLTNLRGNAVTQPLASLSLKSDMNVFFDFHRRPAASTFIQNLKHILKPAMFAVNFKIWQSESKEKLNICDMSLTWTPSVHASSRLMYHQPLKHKTDLPRASKNYDKKTKNVWIRCLCYETSQRCHVDSNSMQRYYSPKWSLYAGRSSLISTNLSNR